LNGYPADGYPAACYPEDGYPANGLPTNGSVFALVRCPSCGRRGPDLKRYGYCARCDAFTGLCDAGRSITAESMLKVEDWAHTCTGLAPGRYQLLTLTGGLVEAQLCPAHVAAAARTGLKLVPVRPGRTARHVLQQRSTQQVIAHCRAPFQTAGDRPVRVMVSIVPGDALILQYAVPT
jgi:hypothetical protein